MSDPLASLPTPSGKGREDRDVDRICSLPIVHLPTPDEVDVISRMLMVGKYFEQGERLFPEQAGAYLAYTQVGGAFLPIRVGRGKTFISMLIAQYAYQVEGLRKIVVGVPPPVYEQYIGPDLQKARKWFGLSVPFLFLGGNKSVRARRALAGSDKAGVYVMPYSKFSTQDAEALLSGDLDRPDDDPCKYPPICGIRPDLFILDECHRLKDPTAGRTQRLRRYLSSRDPSHREYKPRQGEEGRRVKIVAMSGTPTSKSIADYYYQIKAALGEHTPLPLAESIAAEWGVVLDADRVTQDGYRSTGGTTGPLAPLTAWARNSFPTEQIPAGIAGFRHAYRLRLATTPGVVMSPPGSLGVSLILQNREVEVEEGSEDYGRMLSFMEQVEEEARTPSGDDIEHGFQNHKYLFELTSGFYHWQRWPSIEELSAKGYTADQAAEALAISQHVHEKAQEVNRCMSRFLQRHARAGQDTPLLVRSHMAHCVDDGARPTWYRTLHGRSLWDAWRDWRENHVDGLLERLSIPVRVCDYKVRHAVEWAKKQQARKGRKHRGNRGGIVWYYHDAIGQWIYEQCLDADLDVIWCPSESNKKGSNVRIRAESNVDRIIVASIAGHGEGKNLQFHRNQHIVQFMRTATVMEQLLGRLHRHGQQAEELFVDTNNTTVFDHENLFACLVDALYIHQTTADQKLATATYDPLPKTYPIDFLRERGFIDLPQLDATTISRLEERFGPLK